MKKIIRKAACTAALAVSGIFILGSGSVYAEELPDGLYVGEYNLGGMTREEAEEAIQNYVTGMENQKITLSVDGQSVETTAGELGFYWSNPEAVEQASNAYEGGNLLRNYFSMKDIEHNNIVIPLETALDGKKVASFVEEKCQGITSQAQDATISRENGRFIVTPSVVGKAVDVEATKKVLDEALAQGLKEPVQTSAVITESQPRLTTEVLSSIQDVLGTFSTDFSSSGASRSTNLRVGAGKINGTVLMPGETLSGYECMKPFTTANGYATASAYENGQVVDSVGGGVCQIATTLYNAAIRAEVEITQRQNHSMVVSYVKPSEDAAIAGTYKDIKFTNNYSTPIYVEGYTSGKTLTFTIYGKETRPANRTFKFVSETLSVSDPGAPIEKEDPSLAPGQRVRVQGSHTGKKSRLWKYIYIDGVEQSREIMHTDTYNASKAVYRVGPVAASVPLEPQTEPQVLPTEPAVTETQPVQTQPAEPVEGIHGGPGVTEPAVQPEPVEGPGG